MYSRSIIKRRLMSAQKKLGWLPMEHSIKEVEESNDRLSRAYSQEDGKQLRPLSDGERHWILNERAMCQCDFRYWLTRYAMIRSFDARIIRCNPNVAQSIMIDVWAEQEEKRAAIMVQQLKARQLGMSTLTELAICHRVQFWPNVSAVVASSDPKKSEKMAEMMQLAWRYQPWWLLPSLTTGRAGQLIEFGGHGSSVSIQHGSQFSGIARGTTPDCFHLSEVPDFDDPENLIDAALLRAVHESPYTLGILESTAAGLGNWWHNTWKISKENWPKGRSRLRPIFLPWFVGTDIWPTETWVKMHPVPDHWEPEDVTRRHAERAESYVRTNDLLSKYLGSDWKMPRHQMWFWEIDRAEHVRKRQLPHFLQEMPADDEEAFQTTNITAFDFETIQFYQERIPDIYSQGGGVYGIQGPSDEIPERLQPASRQIDRNKPSIEITCRWNPIQKPYKYTLVPLKWQGYSEDDGLGKFYIWEMPKKDYLYGVGVDLSEGIGLDRSALEVLRKGTIEENDRQVCEFASPHANSIDFWPLCMAVGTLYSQPVFGEMRQAKMVIECRWQGENTQHELRKRGWNNVHLWQRTDRKRLQASRANRVGWFTNAWSRPMMMDYLLKGLRDNWIDIHSPWFIHEMKTLEKEEGAQDLRAQYNEHDDRIMALGFCFYSLHYLELRGGDYLLAQKRASLRDAANREPIVYLAGPGERVPTDDEAHEIEGQLIDMQRYYDEGEELGL